MNEEQEIKRASTMFPGENHRQKLLTVASTQRHILLSYPSNLSDQELMDFLGYLTHEFRQQLPPQLGDIPILRRPT